jgi:hypothetical protein
MRMETGPSPMTRPNAWKLAALAVLAGAIALGWGLAWRAASERLLREAENALQSAGAGGHAGCRNMRAGGFPFRIGVFCDRIEVSGREDPRFGAWQLEAGALRSAAQFYNPGHIVAELDGPVYFESDRLPALQGEWETGRASLRAGLSGLKRVSLQLRDARLLLFGARSLASAATAEAHARPGDAPDSADIAFSIGDARVAFGNDLPAFSLDGDLAVAGAADLFGGSGGLGRLVARIRANGGAAEIRSLGFSPATGGSVHVAGRIAIGADGLLDGRLKLDISAPAGIAQFVARLAGEREARDSVERIAAALALLPGEARGIELVFDRGKARLGAIPLGRVPRLF